MRSPLQQPHFPADRNVRAHADTFHSAENANFATHNCIQSTPAGKHTKATLHLFTHMKIALIGYGKMGHMIEEIALSRGHEIVSIIDVDNAADIDSDAFRSADVAIEFTHPPPPTAII